MPNEPHRRCSLACYLLLCLRPGYNISTFLKRILFGLTFATVLALSGPVHAQDQNQGQDQTFDWKIDREALQTLEDAEIQDLVRHALHFGVPHELINSEVDKLYVEDEPEAIPDEMGIKKRLYALIVAQREIARRRQEGRDVDPEATRKRIQERVASLACRVVPAGVATPDRFYHDVSSPLNEEQVAAIEAYAKQLDSYSGDLKAYLDTLPSAEQLPQEEPPDKNAPRNPPMLPEEMDIGNPAREKFESFDPIKRETIRKTLKGQVRDAASCEGGSGCGESEGCEVTVSFETETRISAKPEMRMIYRLSAVPQCNCAAK